MHKGVNTTMDEGQTMIVEHFAIQERATCENPNAGPDGAGFRADGAAYTLEARTVPQAVAFDLAQITSAADRSRVSPELPGSTISKGSQMHVFSALQVRLLTPIECERLQGFPDGWTAIPYRGKPASDGPRYKALGNSMAVPVMAWIGRRIAAVENLHLNQRAA
jgi:DNA (cytosine-5)-methyltransferase 1